MPEKVVLKLDKAGHGNVLTLSGGLTVENAREIKAALAEALAEGRKLSLELREVSSFDLSFIQVLVAAGAKARAEGWELTATATGGLVRAVEAAGFPDLLKQAGG